MPELPGEPGLFILQHPEMEAKGQDQCVAGENGRRQKYRPPCSHRQHADVHRISDIAVEPDNHKLPGRVPGCKRALSRHVEIPNAPEQQNRSQAQDERSGQEDASAPGVEARQERRQDECRQAGEEQECEQGTKEHSAVAIQITLLYRSSIYSADALTVR